MGLQKVGNFELHQKGGYVCQSEFVYMDDNGQMITTKRTGDQLLGQTYNVNPKALGVPDGSVLWFKIWVALGRDNQASQGFIFDANSSKIAEYTCSGTTLDNSLALDKIAG